jgi:hypothetical protein
VPVQLPPRRRGQTKKGGKKTPKHSSNAKETKQQMKSYGRSVCKEEEVQPNLQLLPSPTQTDNTMQFSISSSSSKTHPNKFAAEKTTSSTRKKEENRSRNFLNNRNGKEEEKQQQWR